MQPQSARLSQLPHLALIHHLDVFLVPYVEVEFGYYVEGIGAGYWGRSMEKTGQPQTRKVSVDSSPKFDA